MKKIFISGLCFFLFLSNINFVFANFSKNIKKVFILHSYEKEHICARPQHDGILKVLNNFFQNDQDRLKIVCYYMKTKKINNTPELIKEQAVLAMEKIFDFKPDVLITIDDNAFKSVGLNMPIDIPVVFVGVNGQVKEYNEIFFKKTGKNFFDKKNGKPTLNITGVYEKLYISIALKTLHYIMDGDNFSEILILTDKSTTGIAIRKQVLLELAENKVDFLWRVVVAKDWDDYKKQINLINNNPNIIAIYPAALLLKDNNKTYTAKEIFEWTIKKSKKPEIAINQYFCSKLGIFGGAAVDFEEMGKQAAEKVLKILAGVDISQIPIEDARKYVLIFNLKRAQELKIKIPDDILFDADFLVQ